jgi:branched-chain amino acid transport system permease protein
MEGRTSFGRSFPLKGLFAFIGVMVLMIAPAFFETGFALHIATLILLWAILCLSLNIIFGYAGQLSIAHGGLFGTGAYVYAVLAAKFGMSFWPAFALGGATAGIVGFLMGIPALKLKGPYFVIVTLGFNIIIVSIIENLENLTEGVNGLVGIPSPESIRLPFFTMDFTSKISQYYLIAAFLVFFLILMYFVKNSRLGRCLVAIKEDEELCRSAGLNTMWIKVQTFVLSSVVAGLGGGLFASYIGILTPNDASFHVSFDALVFLTVGGIGTITGAIIGPAIMIIISELLQAVAEVRLLVNGLALVILIIFMPQGIAGGIGHLGKRFFFAGRHDYMERARGKPCC